MITEGKQTIRIGHVEISVVLMSVAMLMLEILQTITMSLQALERNAFLVVSLCLLGLGSGGSIATWLCARPSIQPMSALWWSTVGFAITLVLSTIGSSWTLDLPALIVLGIIPYIFVGVFLAFLFRTWPQRANRLYFLNLVGSGLGCLGLVWIVNGTGDAASTILVIAAMVLVAGMFLGFGVGRRRATLAAAGLVVLALLVPLRERLYGYQPAREKGLAMIVNDPAIESETTWSRWGYLGRLDVVKPGQGIENFPLGGDEVRRLLDRGCQVRFLFASGGNWTKAVDFDDNAAARDDFVEQSRHSLAYILSDRPDVLDIGFGGGVDVFLALRHNARSVVGVEINPLMVEAGRAHLAGYFDDFYNDPRVTIAEMDGRTYARNTDRKFDVVSLTAVDTGAHLHSNAHVLLENYLYTHEAFEDYMRILNNDGFLYVSRPFDQLMRTIATAVSVLRGLGAQNPELHFAVLGRGEIGRGRWRSVLVGKNPLTGSQIQRIDERFPKRIAYLPRRQGNDEDYSTFFSMVARGREKEYIAGLDTDYSPISDDRPFFYEFSKDLRHSFAGKVLFRILVWVTAIGAALIIVPLLGMRPVRKAARPQLLGLLGYFAAIGAGFMFIEIGMIQKLVLFLGHPSYSVTVTLFSILVFSGLGSMFARRFEPGRSRTAALIWGPILAAAVFYAAGLGGVLTLVHSDAIALRIVVASLLLAPGSFFMGMPFPTMIRMLQGDAEPLIPWAWAINAFTSVAASVLTVLFAMRLGFTAVMYFGAAFYVAALVSYFAVVRSRTMPAPAPLGERGGVALPRT